MNLRRMWPALLLALMVLPATLMAQSRGLKKVQVGVPAVSMGNIVIYFTKEAKIFEKYGLDVEPIVVAGSGIASKALISGTVQISPIATPTVINSVLSGSDMVILAHTMPGVIQYLMARPDIKQPADLKGKKAGITTFGSTSDVVLRIALKHFNLEPIKDVALLTFGAQPEVFAALQSGAVQVGALSFPLYPKAAKLGMRELIKFGDLGVEDINGTVITTRTFVTQHRDLALRFMRAFTRGMHRYRTDKEFSKRVLAKYGKINDEEILEGTWQDYAPNMQKNPRPSLKAIQFLVENQFQGKKPLPKPEQFVDFSIVDQLEKSGFIDSVNK